MDHLANPSPKQLRQLCSAHHIYQLFGESEQDTATDQTCITLRVTVVDESLLHTMMLSDISIH